MKFAFSNKLFIISLFLSLGASQLYGQEKSTGDNRGPVREGSIKNDGSTSSGLSSDPIELTESSFNKEEVISEIKAQLATMASKQLKELVEFCKKNSIQGQFVVDLTVEGKGKVLTVFMVSGGEDSIPKKNLLKNKLTGLQFEIIKIPKKERVKLRYTLNF